MERRGKQGFGGPAERPSEEPVELLQGTIDRVTYHDEESLYTVLRLLPEKGYERPSEDLFALSRVTAVGHTTSPGPGQRVRLTGSWGAHRVHGEQFEFEAVEILPPIDAKGLARYLASNTFEGIGEILAKRIVKCLGAEALDKIREGPACLDGVRGLRPEIAEKLSLTVAAQLDLHKAHAFLRGLELGPWQSAAVIHELGATCEREVREDPYVLVERVHGIGFATADRIAHGLGLAPDDPRRLRAGLMHALERAGDDGHCFLLRGKLIESALRLLSDAADPAALSLAIDELQRGERVALETGFEEVGGEQRVYLPWVATSESGVAQSLAHLLQVEVAPLADEQRLAALEERSGLQLHADQRAAVLGLLRTPVGLLTGGPGVGKTTIMRLVVELAEEAGARVALASPTGRAAKRLSEASGRDARTIHRLLRWEPAERKFAHGPKRPLEADLVVLDEVSMLDVVLAHHLLNAIATPTRVLLIGDPDQLPSVGAGNVLSDLIRSQAVPVFRLRHIYRQASGSLIVTNSHRVLEGKGPVLPDRGVTDADFYFFPAEESEQAAERLVEVVTQRIPSSFGLDWMRDVQVVAPMYRGACGVDALNERLREAQGAGRRELVKGARIWREGDRVIHTRNDYEKDVFNGDMGRISRISPEGALFVAYPEREVEYTSGELSDLMAAYAITVHRSQGGEFPAVVLPVLPEHRLMLQRNLFYTAITRAKRLLVLVGSQRAIRMAIENTRQSRRESALAEKLVRAAEDRGRAPLK